MLGALQLAVNAVVALLRERSPARRREWQMQLAFDRKYRIDTAVRVPASALRPADPRGKAALHAIGYQPTSVSALHQILQAIPLQYEGWTFIDIGAGKGRALLVGSHYPFQRIVGVELSPHLVEIAQRNITTYRDPAQRCHAIECVCMDASKYPLPAEGNLLLYLYNPFGEPIMRAFLEGIRRVAAEAPRREIWICYANATLRSLFDAADFLQPVANPIGLCLYRVVAARTPA